MSYLYEYTNLSDTVCQGYVKDAIRLSEMTNKVWSDMSFNPLDMWFKIWFDTELDATDQATLEAIVNSSLGKVLTHKTRDVIMTEIYQTAEPTTQLPRLMAALNSQAVFIVALDGYNFDLARSIVQSLVDGGEITTDDQTLVNGIIPASKWVDA